jgi:type I restriction enzyme S subunit
MSAPIIPLGEVTDILSGFAFNSKHFNKTKGIPIIRIRDVTRGYSDTRYDGPFDPAYLVSDGDMLIGMDGEFNIAPWSGGEALLNQRVCKISAKDTSKLNERYLLHFLPKQLKLIEDKTPFVTVKHLSVKGIRTIELPLPSLTTQQRIADTLDAADALRRKDQELLKKYDELAQSIFYEMFGDSSANTQEWDALKIADMIDFMTSGSRGWSAYYAEQGDLFIRINNVVRGKLVLDDVVYVNAPDNAEAKRTRVQPGDVLVSITADLGRTAVIPEGISEAFINQHLALLRFKAEFVPEYIAFYLGSPAGQVQIQRNNKGGVKAGLNFADILGISIPVPPKSLQQKFADALKGVEELSALAKENIQTSQSLFQGILSTSFTAN